MASRSRSKIPASNPEKTKDAARRTRQGQSRRLPPWLYTDPEWEAAKASTRDISLHAGAMESADLSALWRSMWAPMKAIRIDFKKILQTLRQRRIPFVLTGAHGIAGWTGRPRSTHDVDILVKAGRNYIRAVNALKALYPHLEVRRFGNVTAFFVPGETESVIDVTCPHRADNEVTLLTGVWVEEENLKYRVPMLEAALANKYGAMLNPTRDPGKRAQDAVDFYTMVKHSMKKGRQPIDLEKLAGLGEKVWPGGGGKEIQRLVEQAKAGKVPNVNNGE